MDPKVSYFKTFISAAKTKSFSRASKKLSVTQGTVSNHISALEKYFDAQLFLRTPEGVDLTPEGEILYEKAEKILNNINDARQYMRILHEHPEGTVRIAASTTPGENLIPNIIQSYRAEHKDVDFDVQITDSEKCFKLLESGQVDIIAVGNLYDKSYESVIIGKDRLVLIVPPNHRLVKKGVAKLSDLLKEEYIDREEGSGTREAFKLALNNKGYSTMDLDIIMSLGSNSSIITAVSEGYGVGVISEIPAKNAEEGGHVKIIPIEDLDLTRYLYLVKGRKPKNPSAVKSFWDFVSE
ncbi:transcriptional regulator, LysR family [Methanococcus aeolicus Nankai-3]|uniref:Transcriptional regulator, LysR family n=1 Tax=Methanococcus aeolicus (strain ATCC BAA-1280 / DSM 17508 / OCM 812 / Nankai-3) TaxID=419665 RepID=A6UUV9_META3|nr:selenium metabolism-associated LysR family transcriptional regulator [Methanococcus aeolicus]ABR56281.1 transcriptional regulator, LysR family [Methanococcus aeolicus Nankai-3]